MLGRKISKVVPDGSDAATVFMFEEKMCTVCHQGPAIKCRDLPDTSNVKTDLSTGLTVDRQPKPKQKIELHVETSSPDEPVVQILTVHASLSWGRNQALMKHVAAGRMTGITAKYREPSIFLLMDVMQYRCSG